MGTLVLLTGPTGFSTEGQASGLGEVQLGPVSHLLTRGLSKSLSDSKAALEPTCSSRECSRNTCDGLTSLRNAILPCPHWLPALLRVGCPPIRQTKAQAL